MRRLCDLAQRTSYQVTGVAEMFAKGIVTGRKYRVCFNGHAKIFQE